VRFDLRGRRKGHRHPSNLGRGRRRGPVEGGADAALLLLLLLRLLLWYCFLLSVLVEVRRDQVGCIPSFQRTRLLIRLLIWPLLLLMLLLMLMLPLRLRSIWQRMWAISEDWCWRWQSRERGREIGPREREKGNSEEGSDWKKRPT